MPHRALSTLVTGLVWFATLAPVNAQTTQTDHDATCTWTSTIFPSSMGPAQECNWLNNGLSRQGITPGTWNINYLNLSTSLQIDTYLAWVTTRPAMDCGALHLDARTVTRTGGAEICLRLEPETGNPPAVRWIQAIRTNCPIPGQTPPSFNEGNGFVQYIDNFGNPPNDPFYDPIGLANGLNFVDAPGRQCPTDPCNLDCTWQACVFGCTYEPAPPGGRPTVNFYDPGVTWGFHFTCTPIPTPGAASLLILTGVLAFRRRRAGAQTQAE